MAVYELHSWRPDQYKSVASAHVVVDSNTVKSFADQAKITMECLHADKIHSVTLQPEVLALIAPGEEVQGSASTDESIRRRRGVDQESCQLICGNACETKRCCVHVQTQ